MRPRNSPLNGLAVLDTRTLPAGLRRATALVLTGLLAAALASGATAAHADDIDAISGGPSDGTGSDSRSRYSYEIDPGQQLSDYYLARNTGTTALTLTVFATDAFNADDGGFALLDTAEKPVGAGSWVTFAEGATKVELPLAPGESRVVPFTVTVPADASPGDHPAGMVISVTSGSGQVLVDKRIATRLYVRVTGDLQPILKVTSYSAEYTPSLNPLVGSITIKATIANEGNVALGAKTVVGVKTYFGIPLSDPRLEEIPEILPGGKVDVSFVVEGIAQLGYINPYLTVQPTASKESPVAATLPQVTRDSPLLAMPWWLLILLVIAALVWVILRIRTARDEKAAIAWIEYTEAEARRKALESTADETADAPARA